MLAINWDERLYPENLAGLLIACKSERKLRLLACALIRHMPYHPDGRTIWDLLPESEWFEHQYYKTERPNLHEVIAVIERYADGHATVSEWEVACGRSYEAVRVAMGVTPLCSYEPSPDCWFVYLPILMIYVATEHRPSELARWMFCFRDKFPDEYRVDLHPNNGVSICSLIRDSLMGPERRRPIRPEWLTEPVKGLAAEAYENHRFDILPILGTTLEKAGCSDQAMLRHCREPGLHARGCWVLDRVLGFQ